MERALWPHPCSRPPPVELGTFTVMQPLREAPYSPGRTAAQMPTPAKMASSTTPASSMTRRSRRVTGSAAGIDENGMTGAV